MTPIRVNVGDAQAQPGATADLEAKSEAGVWAIVKWMKRARQREAGLFGRQER